VQVERDWLIAFAVGAAIILLFARERLNRPLTVEEGAERRGRLLELLAPAQLRRPGVFFKGYLFYAALLLVVFMILSVGTSSLGLLLIGGEVSDGVSFDDPAWPLAVALGIVGLAPGFPILSRIEEKFRRFAQDLVGVPASFNAFTDALLEVPLDRAQLPDDLIGREDAQRLDAILARAEAVFGEGTHLTWFAQCAMKLFAFRAWATGGASWPGYAVRHEFRRIEAEVAPMVEAALADMIDLGLSPREAAPDPNEDIAAAQQRRATAEDRWRHLAARAEAASEGACALFALYAERAETMPVKNNPISEMLRGLIENARAQRRRDLPGANVLAGSLVVVGAAAFLIGYAGSLSGVLAYPGMSHLNAGLSYLVGVVALYGPASFLAWSARHPAPPQKWRNAMGGGTVFPAIQYLALFGWAWLVSALTMTAFILFQQIAAHVAAVAADATRDTLSAACVMTQLLGVTIRDSACPTTGSVWQAVAYGVLGAWNAVTMALLADCVESARPRRLLERALPLLHGAGLAALNFMAAEWLGRMPDAAPEDMLTVPLLGFRVSPAAQVIAAEALSAALLGLLFAMVTLMALRRLHARPVAPPPSPSAFGPGARRALPAE